MTVRMKMLMARENNKAFPGSWTGGRGPSGPHDASWPPGASTTEFPELLADVRSPARLRDGFAPLGAIPGRL